MHVWQITQLMSTLVSGCQHVVTVCKCAMIWACEWGYGPPFSPVALRRMRICIPHGEPILRHLSVVVDLPNCEDDFPNSC